MACGIGEAGGRRGDGLARSAIAGATLDHAHRLGGHDRAAAAVPRSVRPRRVRPVPSRDRRSVMITTHTLKILLLVGGLLHLCITSAGFTMTFVLNWRKNLSPLCALTRHIVWSHAAFVLL